MSNKKVIYDSIAQKLLQAKCYNTALEFHNELSERGKVIPRLRDYFNNQEVLDNNFKDTPIRRTSSIQTFESLDFTRFSEDSSYQVEEKIAVLEYELRKANETIKLLRENLTQQTTGTSDALRLLTNDPQPFLAWQTNNSCPPIRSFEKRAINFLVNEYLLTQGYRLTSITFADENEDQDFEDWSDVGIDTRRPADLLSIIRAYNPPGPGGDKTAKNTDPDTADKKYSLEAEETNGIFNESPTQDLFIAELDELRKRVSELTRQNIRLGEQARHFQKELERALLVPGVDGTIKEEVDMKSEKVGSICQSPVFNEADCSKIESVDTGLDIGDIEIADRILEKSSKYMSSQFRRTLLRLASPFENQCFLGDPLLADSISHLSRITRMAESCEELVDVLAHALPNIFPNVLITKREELIPLLLSAAHLHLDTKIRDTLLNILFNLVKRPDQNQRRVILLSCLKYAQSAGPTRINLELLPQCWEQISHKHPERRLLIAETCGLLAPYVLEDIRESLLLSMLQQLFSEERDSNIRCAVLKSLALIFPFVRDKDKFNLALEIINQAMFEADDNDVYHVTKNIYLPALAIWTEHLGLLQNSLTSYFSSRLETTVKTILGIEQRNTLNTDEEDKSLKCMNLLVQKSSSKTQIRGKSERDILICLSCLETLIPFLYHSALINGPYNNSSKENSSPTRQPNDFDHNSSFQNTDKSVLADIRLIANQQSNLAPLQVSFEALVKEEWYLMWHELGYLIQTLLPTLIKCALLIEMEQCSNVLRHYFCSFFRSFVKTFGTIFTNSKVEPLFSSTILALANQENTDIPDHQKSFTKLIIPVYIVGILDALNKSESSLNISKAAIFLKDIIVSLSLSNSSIKTARASVQEFCQYTSPKNLSVLTKILTNLSSHPMASVRVSAAKLTTEIVPYVAKDMALINQHFNLLHTLASDMDIMVKIVAVESLGTVIQFIPPKPSRDDTDWDYLEIIKQSFGVFYAYLRNPYGAGEDQRFAPLVIRLLGRVGTETECNLVRENYIIPCLAHVISACNVQSNQQISVQGSTKISEILSSLFQALSTLSCCDNSQPVIRDYFLPSLASLKESAFSFLTPDHEKVLDSMIKDQEIKLKNGDRKTKNIPHNNPWPTSSTNPSGQTVSTSKYIDQASRIASQGEYFGVQGPKCNLESGSSHRLLKKNDHLKGEVNRLQHLGNIFTRKKS